MLPRDEWDIFDPEVLTALLAFDKGEQLLTEYLECRRIIEIEAAGLAAERATDEDRREMASAFERMVEDAEKSTTSAAAESRYRDADIQFHRSILRATKNRALASTAEPIYEALRVVLPSLVHPEARTRRAVPSTPRSCLQSRPDNRRRLGKQCANITTRRRSLCVCTSKNWRPPAPEAPQSLRWPCQNHRSRKRPLADVRRRM